MVGFILKDIKGIFGLRLQFICPICKSVLEISERDTVKYNFGYKIKSYDCRCGYSSNIIITNKKNIPKTLEFNRTCKECGKQWNFNINDVLLAEAENLKTAARALAGIAGSPIGLLPNGEIKDYNRCDSCGSRKVKISLNQNDQGTNKTSNNPINPKNNSADNSINDSSYKKQSPITNSRVPTSRRKAYK